MKSSIPVTLLGFMCVVPDAMAYEKPEPISGEEWIRHEKCTIVDNSLFAPFGGDRFVFEVVVEEHPSTSGFFRIEAPYSHMPSLGKYYQYDGDCPDYLYINAIDADEVFFSDAEGNPVTHYHTNLRYEHGNGFVEDYGWGWLMCMYNYYLLEEDYVDYYEQIFSYNNYADNAGKMTVQTKHDGSDVCIIRFGEGDLYGTLSFVAEFNGPLAISGTSWILLLGSSEDPLGKTKFTDGFIGQYYMPSGLTVETYDVDIEAYLPLPGMYRIKAPYSEENWIYGNSESMYDIYFDVSDPDFVLVNIQNAYTDKDGTVQIANAAGLYMSGLLSDENSRPIKYTKEQVIEQGLADKVENGVVVINHPVLITPKGYIRLLYEDNSTLMPARIVMPDGNDAVEEIVAEADELQPAEYYNLQGVRVMNPSRGLYIRRQGPNTEKVVIR
ncbi:MAG: hypothetical protein K2H14_02580 [Muribaculaceae bacterium]|nr:hypothetical protein [Muribaculaceae bacterium]